MHYIDNKRTSLNQIQANQTTSAIINLRNKTITGIAFPVTVGDTFTFEVAISSSQTNPNEAGTFYPLRDKDNKPFTITKTPNEQSYHYIDASVFSSVVFVKIISNQTETNPLNIEIATVKP